uniref:Uncharacterized protein n=1 Tax=Avena sativa TaxID=4498 RepID=A0ACD5VGJ6_AVESA
MDDATLLEEFPADDLEANEYYLHYEVSYEWYFDPVYCRYVHFQGYQRLMLQNNGKYEDWEYYRVTCNTLEGDQEYVKFWEKLLSESELIKWYVTRTTYDLRIERLFHYHTLKIATLYPNVYKTLVNSGCMEFRRSLVIDFIWSRPFGDFLFEMWKLLTCDKMSFKDALSHLFNNAKYSFVFAIKAEFEPNLRPLENMCKPLLGSICEKSSEDAKRMIKEYVTGHARKPKTYYDYVKELYIAKKIGLIPSSTTKDVTKQFMVTP